MERLAVCGAIALGVYIAFIVVVGTLGTWPLPVAGLALALTVGAVAYVIDWISENRA